MQLQMRLSVISFPTRLKAFFFIIIIIILLMMYGLSNQGYLPMRLIVKSQRRSMYSDYFANGISKRNASIVVIVLSATANYERRKAIRETWWKDCQKHDKLVCKFMIDKLNATEDNYHLLQEINHKKDIIISPIKKGMLFGHRILFAMHWSLHHYNFDYLMRVDDDVMLCIEHILHRYRLIPRTNFISGVLHCDSQETVYIDEGTVTFSQDIVRIFLSQDPDYMYCHTYGDQTYSTWINDLKLNGTELYHIERRIHHHPPVSRVRIFRNRTQLCNQYIALHGVYGNDMKWFWNRRGTHSFPSSTGLRKVNEVCRYEPIYNSTKFKGLYGFEPKLCNDPEVWTDEKDIVFARELQSRYQSGAGSK